ncbi:MAG: hypothetical protein V3S01_06060 [Dehalococcoidia bacterium]
MALTLAEAAKLSNDTLLAGVVETIVKDSPVLQRLPFIEMTSNHLYSQMTLRASAIHLTQPTPCRRPLG